MKSTTWAFTPGELDCIGSLIHEALANGCALEQLCIAVCPGIAIKVLTRAELRRERNAPEPVRAMLSRPVLAGRVVAMRIDEFSMQILATYLVPPVETGSGAC